MSTNCAQCLQIVHSVYMYAQCQQTILGETDPCNLFYGGAWRPILNIVSSHLQHVHSVDNMCTLYNAYAQCLQTIIG